MKKVTSAILIYILSIIFILSQCSLVANAININTELLCSLTLCYQHSGRPLNNLNIKIFRIAEISKDGTYSITNDFSKYPIDIDKITSQSEWNLIASTLSAYISADKVSPTQVQNTDSSGIASFKSLPTGLYLILPINFETSTEVYKFDSFFVSLPNKDENDAFLYDVLAKPKSESYKVKSTEIEYTVIKHWKDNGYTNKRPKSIQVEILKNGITQTIQTLSTKNNWSYSWKALDDGSIWQVVERNVPQDYTVILTSNKNTTIITNTYNYNDNYIPDTGIITNLHFYIIIMCILGTFLIILGISNTKKES